MTPQDTTTPEQEPISCHITKSIEEYRKDFLDIMQCWDFSSQSELEAKLKEEMDELSREIFSSRNRDFKAICDEFADVLIVFSIFLRFKSTEDGEQEITLTEIIERRLRSNIDRATRAAASAEIKGTAPKDEWATTVRGYATARTHSIEESPCPF